MKNFGKYFRQAARAIESSRETNMVLTYGMMNSGRGAMSAIHFGGECKQNESALIIRTKRNMASPAPSRDTKRDKMSHDDEDRKQCQSIPRGILDRSRKQ